MGTMGIPGIEERKYTELETIIGEWWNKEPQKEIIQAGGEKRQPALEFQDYFQGILAVTEVCDGG